MTSSSARTIPTAVADTFDSYPDEVRQRLLELRELVLATAAEVEGVGRIEETLKWGQPSYLTPDTGAGTTIRVAPTGKGSTHDFGLFVPCGTDLLSSFRDLFGDTLDYDGNRAVLFRVGDPLPIDELRECITMALTYHQRPK